MKNPDELGCGFQRKADIVVSLPQRQYASLCLCEKKCVLAPTGLSESSAYDTPIVHTTQSASALLLFEGIPEPERLIASTRDYYLAIGTHCKVKYTVCMPRQGYYLLHAGVLPDDDLILTVAMC